MSSSPILQSLITHFSRLPGIGPKTAERLVFYLLKQDKKTLTDFGQALLDIKDKIRKCANCGQITEHLSAVVPRYNQGTEAGNLCSICADSKRDHSIICVVSESTDITPLEKSGEFSAVYHVLDGVLNPTEGITPDKLNIQKLEERIDSRDRSRPVPTPTSMPDKNVTPTFRSDNSRVTPTFRSESVKEVILALNPTIEGETTNLYLTKVLKKYNIKITKLARGLPQGADLEYADEITLANAFKGRTTI